MGASSSASCVVIGDIFVDVMAKVQGLPEWDADTEASSVKVLPGGSALNQARHLHALGVGVNFLGAVGDDSFGDMLTRHVTKQGFPFDYVKVFPGLPTSVCIVLSGPSDRGFVSCYSTTDAFSTRDVEERRAAFAGAAHIHIGGYFNLKGIQNKEFAAVVQRCRDAGQTVSLNCQHDAAGKWTGEDDSLRELFPLLDLFFGNEVEVARVAKALVGAEHQLLDAAEALCQAFPKLILVITKGKDGATVLRRGAPAIDVGVQPVTVVDATGAGDAFLAGFLSVWQPARHGGQATEEANEGGAEREEAERLLLRRACLRGHEVACLTVGREGACVEPVTLEDLQVASSGATSAAATA